VDRFQDEFDRMLVRIGRWGEPSFILDSSTEPTELQVTLECVKNLDRGSESVAKLLCIIVICATDHNSRVRRPPKNI